MGFGAFNCLWGGSTGTSGAMRLARAIGGWNGASLIR
jgi:hypothetical protein